MTNAYIYPSPTADPDAFTLAADALTVVRLSRDEPGEAWRLESAAPLLFSTVEFEADLDADEAQRVAVDWLGSNQSDELDEILD